MANYDSTIYSGSLRDKSLEVANLFTQSEHWEDEQTNEGILGMYDWIPSDGDLYLAEINTTHIHLGDILDNKDLGDFTKYPSSGHWKYSSNAARPKNRV